MSPAKKKEPEAKITSQVSASQRSTANAAIAAILKKVKQKPITEHKGIYGHIPSGSTLINTLISGASVTEGAELRCPGYPRRHITEIYGPESSGKCLTADTYISTGAGLLTVAEMFAFAGHEATCTSRVVEGVQIPVCNRYGELENATTLTWNNRRPVFAVHLADGATIKSTANHPHLVLDDGHHVWRKTQDMKQGDWVVAPVTAPCFGGASEEPDVAYALGNLIADGFFGDYRVSITNDDPEVLRVIRELGPEFIGSPAHEHPTDSASIDIQFNSKEGVKAFYQTWGLSSGLAATKVFSRRMRGFDQEAMGHLLAGYLDCEASYHDGTFEVTSASRELLQQTRLMLRGFGVYATIQPKVANAYPDTPYWRLFVTGGDVATLQRALPLRRDFGFEPASASSGITRSIPGVQRLVRAFYAGSETTRVHSRLAGDLLSGASESAAAVLRMLDSASWGGSDPLLQAQLRNLASYEYVKVQSIEPCGLEPTFDIVVPGTHSFVAEGIATHNTSVALAAVASVQKSGGVAMYLDLEHALDHRYARACGVRFDESLLLYAPDTMEESFQIILVGLLAGVDLVVVDSVAAMIPKAELEKGLDDAAKIGVVAAKMSQTLPKLALWLSKYPSKEKHPNHPGTSIILLNQERSKIDTGGGRGGGGDNDPNTSGGKALKFYSYLRLRFQKIKCEFLERKDPVSGAVRRYSFGNVTKVKVVKTKVVGNQGDDIMIFIRYGLGLDDMYSLIEVGTRHRIVARTGAIYTWNGQKFQGKDKLRAFFLANPLENEKLKKLVTQAVMTSTQTVKDEELSEEDEISEALDNEMPDTDEPEEEVLETEDEEPVEGAGVNIE
jgi:protein RecA